jgi:hypothetical protein
VDGSGNLVAAGTNSGVSGMPPQTFVGRFKDGGPDPSFGKGGVASDDTFCTAVAVAARLHSGAVVTAGSDNAMDVGCFAQWDPSGKLQWAKNGMQGGGGPFIYAGLAAMGDAQDRVYMVGSGGDMYARSAELDRVMTTGELDPSFGPPGSNGKVSMGDPGSPPALHFLWKAVAVQPDGLIVIAGAKVDATGQHAVLGRFWP